MTTIITKRSGDWTVREYPTAIAFDGGSALLSRKVHGDWPDLLIGNITSYELKK